GRAGPWRRQAPRRHARAAGRAGGPGAGGRCQHRHGDPAGDEWRGRCAMTRSMPLSHLLPDVALQRDLAVSGLVLDSRKLRPGDAFVAIDGFGTHGLAFAAQARQAGAAAILFEPPAPSAYPAPEDAIAVPGLRARLGEMADLLHGHPSRAMTMVGVTGTNGKTSTVQLLVQAWQLRGLRSGSIGTLGAGLHGQVRPTGFTTPLVLDMHALLGGLR